MTTTLVSSVNDHDAELGKLRASAKQLLVRSSFMCSGTRSA